MLHHLIIYAIGIAVGYWLMSKRSEDEAKECKRGEHCMYCCSSKWNG